MYGFVVAVSAISWSGCSRITAVASAATIQAGSRHKGRTQVVNISAPWPTSCLSPLAEASEFVAEGIDGSTAFWDYVESLGDIPQWIFDCESRSYSRCSCHDGEGTSCGDDPIGALDGCASDMAAARRGQEREDDMVDAKGEVSAAAVKAAGQGFGGDYVDGGKGSSGGGNGGAAGLGMDELSLRLMEVALSARCVAKKYERAILIQYQLR